MNISHLKRPLLGCLLACTFLTIPAFAAEGNNQSGSSYVVSAQSTNFSKFTPLPRKATKLDYSMMNDALSFIVMDLGPSLRTRAIRPQATTGSRFVTGHTSPYRMEGSRVIFDYIDEKFLSGLTQYRQDLEAVGTKVDIASLQRGEQLAYWFNLHNIAVLEKIAEHYPTDRPSNIKIKIDGEKVLLDDAKFLTVSGQKLSLRDIRENIVYKNWSDPLVIYGFYRGDIGSPKIARSAFSANSLDYRLEDNAAEFVNSLRGFRKGTQYRYISKIYSEVDGTLFKNFDVDLTAHLLKYAREDVIEDVSSNRPFKVETYESMIADLSGGRRLAASGNALAGSGVVPREIERFLSEAMNKRRVLIDKGMIRPKTGYVIIEDLVPEKSSDSAPNN